MQHPQHYVFQRTLVTTYSYRQHQLSKQPVLALAYRHCQPVNCQLLQIPSQPSNNKSPGRQHELSLATGTKNSNHENHHPMHRQVRHPSRNHKKRPKGHLLFASSLNLTRSHPPLLHAYATKYAALLTLHRHES
jgi:hypothetical protein